MRVGGENPKNLWWNNQVKPAVKRKEDAWKVVLGARDEDAKERCLEVYKEVQEQFARQMNGDVNGNRK